LILIKLLPVDQHGLMVWPSNETSAAYAENI